MVYMLCCYCLFDKLADVPVDEGGIVGVGVVTSGGNIDQGEALAFGPMAAIAQTRACMVVFADQKQYRTA